MESVEKNQVRESVQESLIVRVSPYDIDKGIDLDDKNLSDGDDYDSCALP